MSVRGTPGGAGHAHNRLAKVLPFAITNVIPDVGGDSRYVTTTILAQFHKDAIVAGPAGHRGIHQCGGDQYTKITAISICQAPHDFTMSPSSIPHHRARAERTLPLAWADRASWRRLNGLLRRLDSEHHQRRYPLHFLHFGIPELAECQGLQSHYVTFASNFRAPEGGDPATCRSPASFPM
jgi:hypothetical protein